MITQFLGGTPNAPTTPPLDQYGNPATAAASAASAGATGSGGAAATTAPASTGSATTTPSQATTPGSIPSFDPRPC
jgi:hypothetical protein